MKLVWQEHIDLNRERAPGVAYCKGTSHSALSVITLLWMGFSEKDVSEYLPGITLDHILACRLYFQERQEVESKSNVLDYRAFSQWAEELLNRKSGKDEA